MSENKEFYAIKDCLCQECSFKGDVDIPKGIRLEDAVCPTCGNKGLYKRPQITNYYEY